METTIMNNMCRCCASEGAFKDIKTTYRWMGEDEVYGDMLKDCFDITLSASDSESGICEVCITQLRNAANFKKQVLHTEEQFLKHGQNKLFKPNIVKVELPVEDVLDGDDNNLSGDDAFSGAEYELPIKTEKVEEPKTKKRAAAKASTSRSKKQKTSDGEDTPAKSKQHKQRGCRNRKTSERDEDTKNKNSDRGELDLQRQNLREILMCSNATPIRRYSGIGYTCCYCEEQYPRAADLKQHTLSSHTDIFRANFMTSMSLYEFVVKLDITDLCCTICNRNINTFSLLINHLTKIHKKTIYTNIKSRIVPIRFNNDMLQCDICLSEFNNLKLLLTHMHTHYKNHVCTICEAGFMTNNALHFHSAIHKVGEFQCDHCTKVFKTYTKKVNHQTSVHTRRVNPYKCGYCLESFNDYNKRLKHLQEMHGMKLRTYPCLACDKNYNRKKDLTTHTNRDHLMLRPHKCPECDKSFYRMTMLKYHMVQHSGERNFQCGVCQKWYTLKKTLRMHMRIHENDRRFKCEHCGQAFIQKCSWRAHMKSKHGDVEDCL
ncbi:zinc finger protein 845 isoform X7 [Manduca sexta]|uniref:zinc finger protein 845 isoform X7 n=1 Tax=Manduca sexta TaxID=7130 RepID=UPI0011837616|nr:zinc finger protein 845 isoform X7 [Manduca sexta]